MFVPSCLVDLSSLWCEHVWHWVGDVKSWLSETRVFAVIVCRQVVAVCSFHLRLRSSQNTLSRNIYKPEGLPTILSAPSRAFRSTMHRLAIINTFQEIAQLSTVRQHCVRLALCQATLGASYLRPMLLPCAYYRTGCCKHSAQAVGDRCVRM